MHMDKRFSLPVCHIVQVMGILVWGRRPATCLEALSRGQDVHINETCANMIQKHGADMLLVKMLAIQKRTTNPQESLRAHVIQTLSGLAYAGLMSVDMVRAACHVIFDLAKCAASECDVSMCTDSALGAAGVLYSFGMECAKTRGLCLQRMDIHADILERFIQCVVGFVCDSKNKIQEQKQYERIRQAHVLCLGALAELCTCEQGKSALVQCMGGACIRAVLDVARMEDKHGPARKVLKAIAWSVAPRNDGKEKEIAILTAQGQRVYLSHLSVESHNDAQSNDGSIDDWMCAAKKLSDAGLGKVVLGHTAKNELVLQVQGISVSMLCVC